MLVIALVALIASACSSSRQTAVTTERMSTTNYTDFTNKKDSVVVEMHDTLTITKTITIRENEQGDTVRMSVVTDRDRSRSLSDVRSKKEEVRVIRDTVCVEKRDSSFVKNTNGTNGNRASPVVLTLKWVFWIIIALIALMIVIKVSRMFRI